MSRHIQDSVKGGEGAPRLIGWFRVLLSLRLCGPCLSCRVFPRHSTQAEYLVFCRCKFVLATTHFLKHSRRGPWSLTFGRACDSRILCDMDICVWPAVQYHTSSTTTFPLFVDGGCLPHTLNNRRYTLCTGEL